MPAYSSEPSHAANGSSICRRLLDGSMSTSTASGSADGGAYAPRAASNPPRGTSSASPGGSSLNLEPSAASSSSASGLNERRPPRASATTSSGLPIKFIVFLLPSLRPGKLRLKLVTMVFSPPPSSSGRLHCPMHGPHALARTVAPMDRSEPICPSLSIVARICSEPGVTSSGAAALAPRAAACSATAAALDMSSYEELVQLPTRAAAMRSTYPEAAASPAILDTGLARSGVCGPTMCGSSADRSISRTRSKHAPGSSSTPSSAERRPALARAMSAMPPRPVALRYASIRASYGNTEDVAPISAPMFAIVALPVQLIEDAPGPKYSTTALVPPDTVSSDATRSMTSLGAAHPPRRPVSRTPIRLGHRTSHGMPAIASAASTPPTPTASIPRPPAFGVCESVPIMRPPGKA